MSTENSRKENYRNRRKTFHFSQKNDDLLQFLNSKETKEQSKFMMRVIREAMENEGKQDPLQSLQAQLNQALDEIQRLKENLANPIPVAVQNEGSGIDEEVINRLFVMLADIKHSNEQNFAEMKQMLQGANVIPTENIIVHSESEELTDEEFDDLFDDDLDF